MLSLQTERQVPRKVVLVGNPNVGKSAVFSRLTSRYVTISNYPGTTVDLFRGRARIQGRDYEFVDTPGIQALHSQSEDEQVTSDVLRNEKPDLILQVADGKNLRRTLLLTAQLSKLKRPLVLALNMKDECDERGIQIDAQALSKRIGVPVVQTTAITGDGFPEIVDHLDSKEFCSLNGHPPSEWVEEILQAVRTEDEGEERWTETKTNLLSAAVVLGALVHLENYLGAWLGLPTLYGLLGNWLQPSETLAGSAREAVRLVIAYLLPVLLPFLFALRSDSRFNERFGIWARKFSTGIPILVVALSVVYQMVGNLGAQILVDILENGVFAGYLTPLLRALVPAGLVHDFLLGEYGAISVGLTYGIAIVLPVVASFFIAFSFLEDSGYLPRLAVLSDRLFRLMGLNGKAFLPMILGLGCVTMATMTTRILNSKKERLIATVLLALGVPCSAQLGVILGIITGISPLATAIIFGTVLLQLFVVGLIFSRILPGKRSDFVLELPPIRYPHWKNIAQKTGLRVKWFLKEALPLFVLGTVILFVLDRLSLLGFLVAGVQPIVTGLLELPSKTATVFFLGFLRRDYGAAGLFDMARNGLLTTQQIVVSLTVMTLFVPCIANFFIVIREQGLRNAFLITAFISGYAIAVGALLNMAINFVGLVL
ncbi:MAG: ferrous iron transport protein B [Acidobacteria bacterium]|nr:MAG: ferrous iron transport protein B [Acidobacteriota bacterium]